jgi:hypothetical protein
VDGESIVPFNGPDGPGASTAISIGAAPMAIATRKIEATITRDLTQFIHTPAESIYLIICARRRWRYVQAHHAGVCDAAEQTAGNQHL